MPEGYISVNYNDVDNVGEALIAGTKAIRAMLDDLEQAIQPLRATWSGEAENEYEKIQRKWDADCDRMNQILASSSTTLEDMSFNYKRTDLNLALNWSDIG